MSSKTAKRLYSWPKRCKVRRAFSVLAIVVVVLFNVLAVVSVCYIYIYIYTKSVFSSPRNIPSHCRICLLLLRRRSIDFFTTHFTLDIWTVDELRKSV